MKRLFFILLFFLQIQSYASHIVGGNFDLIRVRGNQYTLRLNLYFDHLNGAPGAEDDAIRVYVFEQGTNQYVTDYLLLQEQDQFIQYQNPQCALKGEIETRHIVYETSVILDPTVYNSPFGYYIVWERCCRNEIIDNIQAPDSVGMAFYMEFPATSTIINTSPIFNPVPTEYVCRNQFFAMDFSANDVNGDSLVYKMVPPLIGHTSPFNSLPGPNPAPYDSVTWMPGFSSQNAIPGPVPLQIDPVTGVLSGQPSTNGLYVFGVVVEEYRNGVKIGEVNRDFQFLVKDCPPNVPPTVQIKEQDSTSFYVEGDTIHINPLSERCFRLFITDSSDQITATPVKTNFPKEFITFSGTVSISGPGVDSTSEFCLTDCADSDTNTFFVDIQIKDNGCPVSQSDTIRFVYTVDSIANNLPEIGNTLNFDTIQLKVGNDTAFAVYGTDIDSNDFITITAQGTNFSMDETGMQWSDKVGKDSVASVFYWATECEDILRQPSYTVLFKVRDNSCYPNHVVRNFVTIELTDDIFDENQFFDYNFVSPNGDGKNDCFVLPILPTENCENEFEGVEVYNRWGARVFKSDDIVFSWCPDNHPDGVYFYLVEYTNVTYKGSISLVR